MKKQLKDFEGQKIAISFTTYEDWLRRKEVNPKDTCKNKHWHDHKEETIYYPFYDDNKGNFGSPNYAKTHNFTILQASDFLEDEFVYLQEYEFSDDKDFKCSTIALFGCKYPKDSQSPYNFLVFDERGYPFYFKYCRKINTEKNEAITKIKELVEKYNIDKKEIYGS